MKVFQNSADEVFAQKRTENEFNGEIYTEDPAA
jgi:hypothetical protein